MIFKSIYFFTLCSLMACTVSCSDGNDDYIPPALEDPNKPDEPDDPLGFVPHVKGDPFDTYRGLVMTGYQGWFGTPGDGCSHSHHNNTKWYHYRENDVFEPGVLRNSIDFWPDMSEYEIKYPVETFTLPGGGHPSVFSSYDESTVMLHFKWMEQYGIDGAFMQRFVGEVIDNPDGKDHFDKVLESAMKASNAHQRAISVMYDLGGFIPSRLTKTLADAQDIMDKYQLKDRTKKQKFYLYQNEKPLIVLWGVGFNDNRPFSLTDVEQLMNGLKEKGFSIMLGVPTYWREKRNDALNDSKLHDLIKAADVIMPWFVGRYGKNNYQDFHNLIKQDIDWCKTNNVEYAPLCFPGSSDRNMHPENSVNERYGGQFLWDQMYHCINSGAKMLYMAMFDEIDEGTALFKCLNKKDVPSNVSSRTYYIRYKDNNYSIVSTPGNDGAKYTLANDYNVVFGGIENELPTDHYLWLTGEGRKMLRREITKTASMPIRTN